MRALGARWRRGGLWAEEAGLGMKLGEKVDWIGGSKRGDGRVGSRRSSSAVSARSHYSLEDLAPRVRETLIYVPLNLFK